MQTKTIIASRYDHSYDWAIPAGMVLVDVAYGDRDPDLDWDEEVRVITFGTVAEACALWGVPFVPASDAPNMDTTPLFPQRPQVVGRRWFQQEAREVAALEA